VRIVYLLENLEMAGGVKVVVEHAEGLAARGHEVSILTRGPAPTWISVSAPIVQVPEFRRETIPECDVLVATWYSTVAPAAEARRSRVAFHFSQGYEAIYPHVSHLAPEIDAAYSLPMPKLLISEHLVRLFQGRFPGPYHVLPQAIRVPDYDPGSVRPAPGRPAVIGLVGPFEALNKGIRVGLAAVARLRKDFPVVVRRASQFALSDEESSVLRPDAYLHAGSVERMVRWYRELDLLIHPSFEAEGFPLPPLEAMASGVPVVLTDIPSYAPISRDAVGWAPPGDEGALAREASDLLSDAALWQRRARRGLEVARCFTLDRAIDVLERIFEESLKGAAQKTS
jgi:glycosyltransferase involved in cell wall biosynthesis